jgi:hypothetical protein
MAAKSDRDAASVASAGSSGRRTNHLAASVSISAASTPRFPLLRNGTAQSDLGHGNTPGGISVDAEVVALKRKFQKVNQELVRQNVILHEQLNRARQEQNLVLQENVRLKSRLVAMEARLKEIEASWLDTRGSVGERVEMLEAIGQHILDLTQFLRLISVESTTNHAPQTQTAPREASDPLTKHPDQHAILEQMSEENRQARRQALANVQGTAGLAPISEESSRMDAGVLADLTANIALKSDKRRK